MNTLNFIRNKGTEHCRELQSRDPARLSHEQRKAKEDAKKFEQIIRESRIRLGLEAEC